MQASEIDTNGATILGACFIVPLLLIVILIFADLCGVKVARDEGVGDIVLVDQLAQEEVVHVWQVPGLEYLWQYQSMLIIVIEHCHSQLIIVIEKLIKGKIFLLIRKYQCL